MYVRRTVTRRKLRRISYFQVVTAFRFLGNFTFVPVHAVTIRLWRWRDWGLVWHGPHQRKDFRLRTCGGVRCLAYYRCQAIHGFTCFVLIRALIGQRVTHTRPYRYLNISMSFQNDLRPILASSWSKDSVLSSRQLSPRFCSSCHVARYVGNNSPPISTQYPYVFLLYYL